MGDAAHILWQTAALVREVVLGKAAQLRPADLAAAVHGLLYVPAQSALKATGGRTGGVFSVT